MKSTIEVGKISWLQNGDSDRFDGRFFFFRIIWFLFGFIYGLIGIILGY
jgi:hypothetical protein